MNCEHIAEPKKGNFVLLCGRDLRLLPVQDHIYRKVYTIQDTRTAPQKSTYMEHSTGKRLCRLTPGTMP